MKAAETGITLVSAVSFYFSINMGDTAKRKKRYPLRGCYFRMGASIAGAQTPELLICKESSALCGVRLRALP